MGLGKGQIFKAFAKYFGMRKLPPWQVAGVEQSLFAANNRYRLLVESIADLAIISLDSYGKITGWNKGAEQMLGYVEQEIMGCSCEILFPEAQAGQRELSLMLAQARALGSSQEFVWRKRRDSSQFWASSMISVMRNEDQDVIGYVKILEDKTLNRQAEEKLRDSEERLRSVLSTMNDGVLTINDQGIVLSLNPAAERIFGYSAEDLLGRNVNELMPEPFRSEHDGYLLNFLTTNQKKIIGIGREVEGKRKDGGYFPMDLHVAEFRQKGKRFFTGIVRDVSDRKKHEELAAAQVRSQKDALEQELRARNVELADANENLSTTVKELEYSRRELRSLSKRLHHVLEEERSKIAKDIHDELGQLLAVIKMGLGRLKKKGAAEDQEQFLSLMQAVDQTVAKMRSLSSELKPVILDHAGLASAVEWLVEGIRKRTGVDCKLQVQGDFSGLDHDVSTGLFRIVQEALTNALKHSGSASFEVSLKHDGAQVELSIRDHGIGMPLVQTQNTSSLGLISMRERALSMGGHLFVGTAADGGTVIRAQVPSALQSSAS